MQRVERISKPEPNALASGDATLLPLWEESEASAHGSQGAVFEVLKRVLVFSLRAEDIMGRTVGRQISRLVGATT